MELFLQELGVSIQDDDIAIGVVESVMKRLEEEVKIEWETKLKDTPFPGFGHEDDGDAKPGEVVPGVVEGGIKEGDTIDLTGGSRSGS